MGSSAAVDEIPPARKAIGQRILAALRSRGISQRELGRRFKKVPSAMNGWTTGRTQPSLEELAQIVEWTGHSADWIIGAPAAGAPPSASDPRVLARLIKKVGAAQRQIAAAGAEAAAAGIGGQKRKR